MQNPSLIFILNLATTTNVTDGKDSVAICNGFATECSSQLFRKNALKLSHNVSDRFEFCH